MDSYFSKIYRTKFTEGVSIPGIIKNGSYFFVDLEVYEDGRVECWNFQDFEHFKNDVSSGWVSVAIPNDKEISISSLGEWTINEVSWLYNKDSFIEYVWSIIKKLNPNLNNIYTYSQKIVNGVKIGESGLGKIYKEKEKYSNDPFPERIIGKGINLFYKEKNDEYYLVRFDIYNQESIVISRLENSIEISLTQLEEMISNEKVLSQLPIGSKVHILGLGAFNIKEEKYSNSISDKLLEIKDMIRVINGKSTTIELCKSIYKQYIENRTEELKTKLKNAYESIPEHRRAYVGDMDVKDTAVRMIIYGEQEIEKWSHYQVAKKMGEKLPTIKIPKQEKD